LKTREMTVPVTTSERAETAMPTISSYVATVSATISHALPLALAIRICHIRIDEALRLDSHPQTSFEND
jgi:hypothetical protein